MSDKVVHLRTSHVKIEAANTGALNAWIKSRPKNLGNGSGSVESNSDFQLAGLPIAPTQPTQRSCGSSKAHTTELARELGMKELYLGGSLLTSAAIADREGDAPLWWVERPTRRRPRAQASLRVSGSPRRERENPPFPAGSQSGRRGSNPRPSAWEADALPTELRPRRAKDSALLSALGSDFCVVGGAGSTN